MIRNIDINEISGGRLYQLEDMARIGTGGCRGCSKCCHGMGTSLKLDPIDTFWLQKALHKPFEDLLGNAVELGVVDSLIIPNIIMDNEKEQCAFLDDQERCSIHDLRPGFCRLFPLGRIYEGDKFSYFIQIKECDLMQSKVRIRKWLDLPDASRYEQYICQWHSFTSSARHVLDGVRSDRLKTKICTLILQKMMIDPWDDTIDFYEQFEKRLIAVRQMTGMA